MKKYLYSLTLLIPLLISALFSSGCDIKNPTEGLVVVVNTISRQTLINVNISTPDGKNVSSPVTVRFSGPDSSVVIDEVNNSIAFKKTANGNFSFAIKDGLPKSASAPVKLILHLKSDNNDYMEVSYPVQIYETGNQRFDLTMFRLDSLKSSGVDRLKNIPTDGKADPATGAVTSPVDIVTPGGTEVVIPKGVVLKDANGSPLSGSLNVSVTSYSQQAANQLPFNSTIIGGKIVTSALACEISVTDQNGKTAGSLQGSGAKVYVPAGNAINPSTQKPYEPGETVYICRMDVNGTVRIVDSSVVINRTVPAGAKKAGNFPTAKAASGGMFELRLLYTFNSDIDKILQYFSQTYIGSATVLLYYTFNLGSDYNPHNVKLELNLTYKSGEVSRLPVEAQNMVCITVERPVSAVVKIAGSPVAASRVLSENEILPNKVVAQLAFAGLPSNINAFRTNFLSFLQQALINNGIFDASRFTIAPIRFGKNSGADDGVLNLPVTYEGLKYFDVYVQGKCPNDNTKLINPSIDVSVFKDGISYGQVQLVSGRGGTYLKDDGTYSLSAE
ncbi:MAG: hypothetical protein ACM3Q2_14160, partial [Syntrophothermus sp.]